VPKNAQAAEARSPRSAARIQTSYRKPFPVGTSRCDVRTLQRGVPTNHSALHDTQLAFRTVATDAPTEAQPFLKWVGGKGQLLDQLDKFFPEKITRYFEPFLGGVRLLNHKTKFRHLHRTRCLLQPTQPCQHCCGSPRRRSFRNCRVPLNERGNLLPADFATA
jgi:hypothetical protein